MFKQRFKEKKLKDKSGLESYGLWLLSQREMSRKSVMDKMLGYAENKDDVDLVLDRLEELGYLNDERYAEMYVRSCKTSKGYGPIKTRIKMKEKGIPSNIIDTHLNESDECWGDIARQARERKFGDLPHDRDEKNRQMRFLASRGFSFNQISKAFLTPDE